MKTHLRHLFGITTICLILIANPVLLFSQANKTADYLAIARSNLSEGDRFSALVTLDSAVLKAPQNADAYFLRATVKTQIQNLEGAIEDLSKVIRIDPGRPEAYFRRALLYSQLQYHRDYSIQDLTQAISLDRSQTKYYVERAKVRATSINTYNGKKEYNLAIDDINRAIGVDPDDGYLYYLRAGYKLSQEKRRDALQDYESAIELDPSNSRYYSDRGLLYLIMEEYELSAGDYRKAISLDPSNPEHFRHLAHAFYNFGDFRSSINAFSESINLLLQQMRENSTREELKEIQDGLKEVYLMRGSAFANLGRDGEACDDFGRSRELGERRALNYMRKYCSN